MAFEILPSVDLRNGQVVRLKQGDYARQLDYPVDPLQTARSFRDAGATWMHVVDLDGAKEGRPVQTELIAGMIVASGLRVEVGGGIRTADDIVRLLDAGAQRVVLGTKAMEDWGWFEQQVKEPRFADRLVLAVDARDGVIAVKGWQESSGRLAVDVARQVSDWPLGAILYTDVAKDGMMTGPNYDATRRLVEAGRVPVIASGGVGLVEHIAQVKTTGAWGCIVGRSLYEGTVDLREALRIAG
ncbi:MAG TPA: 1-(5-phosphoribosyl)-5-[(5-phosphoribosylamino)methylideneamino]imidazole-4-carboxamide isomerase [Tepidisphaeraceae bacterium]|jgi:phosphoribosylformimino-5-aminoimidazole carboxamide ribotide isomerase